MTIFGSDAPISTLDSGSIPQFGGQKFVAGPNAPNMSALSNAGVAWVQRTPAEFNQWYSVCYGNGLFVAVALDGTHRVMTSPDGITWAFRTSTVATWQAVCFGRGIFVAVGDGVVMSSPDGINWTDRTPAAAVYWNSICYGGGTFVAVARSGGVMTSADGVTWAPQTAAAANYWTSVCFGWVNGAPLFVAVALSGTGNRVMTSPDGIAWTIRSSAADVNWWAVCYGNGLFVAVAYSGGNSIATSPDGVNWTLRTPPAYNQWFAVCFGNGLFAAASGNGTNRIMTSPDGITWTPRYCAASPWYGICYALGKFVAVGQADVLTSGGELTTVIPNGLADGSVFYASPLSGQSYTLYNSCSSFIFDPAATRATLTITMPASPVNGQVVTISFGSFGVTTITHNPAGGQTLLSPLTTAAASDFGRWEYAQATATWYRTR